MKDKCVVVSMGEPRIDKFGLMQCRLRFSINRMAKQKLPFRPQKYALIPAKGFWLASRFYEVYCTS
jgi:hypothetical protein